MDRQARRANYYKKLQNDQEYQELVENYIEKLQRNETIKISSDWEDKMNHEMALNEAKLRLATEEVPSNKVEPKLGSARHLIY